MMAAEPPNLTWLLFYFCWNLWAALLTRHVKKWTYFAITVANPLVIWALQGSELGAHSDQWWLYLAQFVSLTLFPKRQYIMAWSWILLLSTLQSTDLFRPALWCLSLLYLCRIERSPTVTTFGFIACHWYWMEARASWSLLTLLALTSLRLAWRVLECPLRYDWSRRVKYPFHLPYALFWLLLIYADLEHLSVSTIIMLLVELGIELWGWDGLANSSAPWIWCIDVW